MSVIKQKIEGMSEGDIKALIDQATQAALNAGCLVIQERIGQTDGGIAAYFLATPAFWKKRCANISIRSIGSVRTNIFKPFTAVRKQGGE